MRLAFLGDVLFFFFFRLLDCILEYVTGPVDAWCCHLFLVCGSENNAFWIGILAVVGFIQFYLLFKICYGIIDE